MVGVGRGKTVMLLRRLSIAGMLGLGLAGPALAQETVQPPAGIAWMAMNDINKLYFDPDDPNNRPPLLTVPPEGMVTAVDINADGKPDWLVDYEKAGEATYCGTGGCLLRLYVSDGPNFVRALDRQVLEFSIEPGGEVRALVHHGVCTPDNWDCRATWRWNAATLKLDQVPGGADAPAPGGAPAIEQIYD